MIRVSEDLFVETLSLLSVSQCSSWCIYCWRCVEAVSCLGCCEMIVMSSAYVITCTFGCVGVGMSCVKRLNSVGDRTEPWGTPF